jgi:chitin synthase
LERKGNFLINQITLCLFILGISSFVAYFTTGLRGSICLEQDAGIPYFEPETRAATWRDDVIINGFMYDFNMVKEILASNSPMIPITEDWHGQNLSPLFSAEPNLCQKFLNNEVPFCSINNQFINSPGLEAVPCLSHEIIHTLKPKGRLSFSYKDVNESVQSPHLLVIYNNAVVNLTSFLTGIEISKFKNLGDISWIVPGNDMTLRANLDYRDIALMKCLSSRYAVGYVGIESAGCAFYSILMILAILIVMAVILARFIMALIFHWAIAPHISTARSVKVGRYDNAQGRTITFGPPNNPSTGPSQDWARSLALPSDLYTICLVTCYSEDEVSIRKTLDSIAATDHPDERKLLFVICDGLIQGEGNEFSTPDIVMSLFEKDPLIKSTEPMSYLAIADGEKQTNMARVVTIDLI